MRVRHTAAIALLLNAPRVFGGEKPNTTWICKTVDGKELKMDIFLLKGYESG